MRENSASEHEKADFTVDDQCARIEACLQRIETAEVDDIRKILSEVLQVQLKQLRLEQAAFR